MSNKTKNIKLTMKTKKSEMIDTILNICESGITVQKELRDLIITVKAELLEGTPEREQAAAEIKKKNNNNYFYYSKFNLEIKTKKELISMFDQLTISKQNMIDSMHIVLRILADNRLKEDSEIIEEIQEVEEIKNCQICNKELNEDGSCSNCEVGFIFNEHCYDCNNVSYKTVLCEELCQDCYYNYNIYSLFDENNNLLNESRFQTMNKAVSATLIKEDGFYRVKSVYAEKYFYKSGNNIQLLSDDMQIWQKFLDVDKVNWKSFQANEYYIEKIKNLWSKHQKYTKKC